MSEIYVRLIGTPEIRIDDQHYEFPFIRAAAMFYYLLIRKKENKSVLADIFWGDKYDDVKANRNYRNAVYTIRRDLGSDVLQNEGRSNLKICLDQVHVDLFEMSAAPQELLEHDSLRFLDHFQVPQCTGFDDFLQEAREDVHSQILDLIGRSLKEGVPEAARLCQKLFRENPFDMDACHLMLQCGSRDADSRELEQVWRIMLNAWQQDPEESPEQMLYSVYKKLQRMCPNGNSSPEEEESKENRLHVRMTSDISSVQPWEVSWNRYGNAGNILYPQGREKEALLHLQEWISMFLDRTEYRKLKFFLKLPEEQLLWGIEQLLDSGAIREVVDEDILYYEFTDEDQRDKIYQGMSETRRRQQHRTMAERFEQQFSLFHAEDLLPRIVYHYMRSGRTRKAEQYLKEMLPMYIKVSHTYFPSRKDYPIDYRLSTYGNNRRQLDYIFGWMGEKVENYRQSLMRESQSSESIDLYLNLLTRFYVKKPDFSRAWDYLNFWEGLSGESEESARQKSALYMDVEDAVHLRELSCRWQKKEIPLSGEMGFWLRLEGIADILQGDIKAGQDCLNKALACFLKEENREEWALNAAVACSWLGESYRREGRFAEAKEHYRWSMDLSSEIHDVGGQSILYLHVGHGMLDAGEMKEAERYLKAAIDSYLRLDVKYKRGLAFLLMARLRFKQGKREDAREFLEQGKSFAELMHCPSELAMAQELEKII